MQLFRIDDPRDDLAKATRDELWDYAARKGKTRDMLAYLNQFTGTPDGGFTPGRPPGFVATESNVTHSEMAAWLRNMGLGAGFKALERFQGRPVSAPVDFPPPETVSEGPEMIPVDAMTIQELRAECKARGIKADGSKEVLRAKLRTNG